MTDRDVFNAQLVNRRGIEADTREAGTEVGETERERGVTAFERLRAPQGIGERDAPTQLVIAAIETDGPT